MPASKKGPVGICPTRSTPRRRRRATAAIHALIHDDNLSALRSATEGAHVFRRYGLYGLRLDG
jgi:hypothetical protein